MCSNNFKNDVHAMNNNKMESNIKSFVPSRASIEDYKQIQYNDIMFDFNVERKVCSWNSGVLMVVGVDGGGDAVMVLIWYCSKNGVFSLFFFSQE